MRIAGHPLHPALAHFPVAFWSLLPLWDGLGLAGVDGPWWAIGFWTCAAGAIVAIPAVVTGTIEMLRLPKDFAGDRALFAHLGCAAAAIAAASLGLMLRGGPSSPAAGRALGVFAADAAAAIAVLATGWLGAVLVYRHGAGGRGQGDGG